MRKLMSKFGICNRKDLYKVAGEAAAFAAVGATNIAVQYGVYHLLLNIPLVNVSWYYTLCNFVSILATWLNSHIWYSLFVFKPKSTSADKVSESLNSTNKAPNRIVRMLIMNTGYLILSSVLIVVFVQFAGVSEEFAPLACIALLIPYSFLVAKLWVYRN